MLGQKDAARQRQRAYENAAVVGGVRNCSESGLKPLVLAPVWRRDFPKFLAGFLLLLRLLFGLGFEAAAQRQRSNGNEHGANYGAFHKDPSCEMVGRYSKDRILQQSLHHALPATASTLPAEDGWQGCEEPVDPGS